MSDLRALMSSRADAFDWDHVRARLMPDEWDLLLAVRDLSDDELLRRLA